MNMKPKRTAALIVKALTATLVIASGTCFAQAGAYPAKPVKLVVGFAAGGPTDVVARAFADHASRVLGQPFVVDNKPGANTILAAEAVAWAWLGAGERPPASVLLGGGLVLGALVANEACALRRTAPGETIQSGIPGA